MEAEPPLADRGLTMTSKHWIRAAVMAWGVLVLVVCVKTILKPYSANIFPTFHQSGIEFTAGRPLYDVPHPHTDNYRYSPLAAAGFAVFTVLPVGWAGAMWRLLGAAVVLSGLLAFSRRVGPSLPWPGFLLFALPLSLHSFHNGQANPIVLGWMLWVAVWACDERWTLAGLVLALAILLKVFPVALAGLYLLMAPLRLGIPTLIGVAIGTLLPYAFHTAEYVTGQYRAWWGNLSRDDRTTWPLYAGYQDFHMLLRVAGVEMSKANYLFVQAGTAFLAAVLVALHRVRRVDRRVMALNTFTVGICWIMLFGASAETATFILLAPVLARELIDRQDRPRWAFIAAVAGAICLVMALIALSMPHTMHRPVIATGIQPLGTLFVSSAALGRIARTLRTRCGR